VYLRVFLFALAAFVAVKIFRPVHPETAKIESESSGEKINISTQVLSFRVERSAELESQPEASQTLLMSVRPERPPSPIVHSIPAKAELEIIRDPKAFRPEAPFPNSGESIVVE
jgi:hypothetical protein